MIMISPSGPGTGEVQPFKTRMLLLFHYHLISREKIMNPVISEVHANFASRPYGKFGRVRKKRTNVTIIAIEKTSSKLGQSKEKKK